jgi:hypothetical protein
MIEQTTTTKATSTNPKDILGRRKPPLWLVPAALILFVSRVMGLGAKKYGPYNWRAKDVRQTVYIEAAMRHLLALQDGEDKDPESGYPHEAHAAACMGIILDARANGNLIDDRPAKGPAARLIAEMTEKEEAPPALPIGHAQPMRTGKYPLRCVCGADMVLDRARDEMYCPLVGKGPTG